MDEYRLAFNSDKYLYRVCNMLPVKRVKKSTHGITRFLQLHWTPTQNTNLILATYPHIKLCKDSDGDYYLHAEVN